VPETLENPRARYRKHIRDEVQARAWEQITLSGASALSLKAIATQMGMTAPALYRYYGSRDELLTELILGGYTDLAELVEVTAARNESPVVRLGEIAQAIRRWAVDNPQRYLLLYGTPVPGYHAPPSATALAQRIFAPILAGFAAESGVGAVPGLGALPNVGADAGEEPIDAVVLNRSVTFWTRLHGVLGLELAGHFAGMDVDPDRLYQDEVNVLLSLVGGG
jgi:AcrR family transcriptional regulator